MSSAVRCPALAGVEPGVAYVPHALHAANVAWGEKNCYIDVWIELVHALGLDPLPMLGFTAALDFEGDQWTFYKPPHNELYELYGLDVQELTVWRPLLDHALEHLPAGRLISTEADAWWLPDTAGTDYRSKHTKTTIILSEVDPGVQAASYFHNTAYHRVEGEDFRALFGIDPATPAGALPLYAETIRTRRIVRRDAAELLRIARAHWAQHVARRPDTNPIERFAARWAADLQGLQEAGLDHYHAWAFATVRQCGSAFELAARGLQWMHERGESRVAPAIEAFDRIGNGCKTLILKGARSVAARKPLDLGALHEMAGDWAAAMEVLAAVFPEGRA
jgi:hypothetical protein